MRPWQATIEFGDIAKPSGLEAATQAVRFIKPPFIQIYRFEPYVEENPA